MPARSKSQQRLFGMLHAYNKGELHGSKALKKRMSEMSKHISDEDARHFAETPHKGLPDKKARMDKPTPKKLKDDEKDNLKYLSFSEVAMLALNELSKGDTYDR